MINLDAFFGLHVEVIGSPTVLNNGKTPNTITIGITNYNLDNSVVEFGIGSTISLQFITEIKQGGAPDISWALANINQINACGINIMYPDGKDYTADWTQGYYPVKSQSDKDGCSGWTFTAKKAFQLASTKSITIQISGLVTGLPNGNSIAYFVVDPKVPGQDVNDFPLTLKFGPLEKTPMVVRNRSIGIDTVDPGSMLDVRGGIRALGGPPGGWGVRNTGYFFSRPGDEDSGMSSSQQGNLELYTNSLEAMRFVHDGNNIEAVVVANLRVAGHTGEQQNPKSGALNNAAGNLEVAGNLKASGRIKDKTGDLMPVGSIIAYGGSTKPEGWLLCDGTTVPSGANYDELRGIVGNTTPDLRDRFIVGAGSGYTKSATGGEKEHTLTVAEMPTHNHAINEVEHFHSGSIYDRVLQSNGKNTLTTWGDDSPQPEPNLLSSERLKGAKTNITIVNSGGSQAHNNLPPYYALTYIIKY